jgi:hypothetical protein
MQIVINRYCICWLFSGKFVAYMFFYKIHINIFRHRPYLMTWHEVNIEDQSHSIRSYWHGW